MTRHHTQPKDREPDSFDQDLHHTTDQGINHAQLGTNPDQAAPNAFDQKELHRLLPNLSSDELRRLVILQPGDVLEQGAVYFDLRHPRSGEIKAEKPEVVGPPDLNLLVPKQQTDYVLWNKLRGVDNPERLDQADDA
ncbi:MAG: hypothetical protein M3R24_16870 [Chloroflexota bacterium]|nr:hypothetical protein [Chloroflexota bacterium]PLS80458.1 MAG: hypothetical protein CYG59_07910 [Chloroflexota bacterium]